jgi:hypothetical protein
MQPKLLTRPETCERKKRYTSFGHAKNDARAIRWKTHQHIDVFHCRLCHGFHLGSQDYDKVRVG